MTANGSTANGAGPNGSPGHKPVNVALQGGGSHGAFTWGVLDRLLEDGRLQFAAISGTSAGAMNAVAVADGWVRGGPEGARAKLHDLWSAVARNGRFSPIQRMPWDMMLGNWSIESSPGYMWYDAMSRLVSPYLANPLGINPVRDLLEAEIDFGNVRSCAAIKLFISATNVETGQIRVFDSDEITLDVVMASACLPMLFKAVEIDGTPYWDGGYGGNPAIFPFFEANAVEDVLLVQINPVLRQGTPLSANEIQNRIDEITFNAALLREFRAIDFVKRLIATGRLPPGEYRDIRMHRIDADEAFRDLPASSKINAEWTFLEYLRDLGRDAASDWLERHYDAVGHEPTIDVAADLSPRRGAPEEGPGKRVRAFLAKHPAPVRARRRP